jgi:hypothetical protein
MHNPGFMGRHDAQPWIHGSDVCTRLQTLSARLHTSANIRRTSAHPRRVAAAGLDAVPSMDPIGLVGVPSSNRLRAGLQLRTAAGRVAVVIHGAGLQFDRVINAGPGCSCGARWIHGVWLQFDRVIDSGPVERKSVPGRNRSHWGLPLENGRKDPQEIPYRSAFVPLRLRKDCGMIADIELESESESDSFLVF